MKSKHHSRTSNLRLKTLSLAVGACFINAQSYAAGTIESIAHGTVNMTQSGATTTISNTPSAIINWHDFNINTGETVIFQQVNAASAVLNRVTGGDMSQILGTLQSNGQVYLINPAGIAIGSGAMINVAGFVASTLNITDADFLSGSRLFNANVSSPGSVVNAGKITTPTGGYVYLVGASVENSGVITTPSGEAILAAGNSVEIVDSSNPSQRVKVSATSSDVNLSNLMTSSKGNIFSVLNKGTISANTVEKDATGRIFFKSAGTIQTTSSSVVEAKGDADNNAGSIISFADTAGYYKGTFNVQGKNGGFLETSGKYLDVSGIKILGKALSSSGTGATWLLDPTDLIIDDSSTTDATNSTTSGTTDFVANTSNSPSHLNTSDIETQLNNGINVVISTDGAGSDAGNITLNSVISKSDSSSTSLTMNATGAITISSTGGITNYNGEGGYNGTLAVTLNSDTDTNGGGGIAIKGATINVNGDINLNSNTGNIVIGDSSSSLSTASFVTGNNITFNATNGGVLIQGSDSSNVFTGVTATGNLNISSSNDLQVIGGSGTNSAAALQAEGNITINTSSVLVNGGSGQGSYAQISSNLGEIAITVDNLTVTAGSGDNASAFITAQGNIVVLANNGIVVGNSATGNNSFSQIKAGNSSNASDLTLVSSSINIIGGANSSSGNIGGSSTVEATRDVKLYSVSVEGTPNITLQGGSGDKNNFAEAIAGRNLIIKGVVSTSDFTSASSNNADISLQGGDSSSAESSGSGNYASLAATNNVLINANSISMMGGSVEGSSLLLSDSAIIGTTTTGVGNVLIDIGTGDLTMNTSSSTAEAAIGNTFGSANIAISAGNVTLNNLSEIGSGSNNTNIDIEAQGQVYLSSDTSIIGAESGTANVTINAFNTLSSNVAALAAVSNGSEGILIQGGKIQDGSGTGAISLMGASATSGGSGVTLIDATVGAVDGSVKGTSITIKGGSSGTDTVTISSDSISLTGQSLVSGNSVVLSTTSSSTTGIQARVASPNIIASSAGDITINNIAATQIANLSSILGESTSNSTLKLIATGGLANNTEDSIQFSTLGTAVLSGNALTNSGATFISNDSGNLNIVSATLGLSSGSSISSAGALNILATNALNADGSTISASDTFNLITPNLSMTNSTISSTNDLNINSLPLLFKLTADKTTSTEITKLFNQLNKNTNINMSYSSITSDSGDVNIAGGTIGLTGSTIKSSSGLASVFAAKSLDLTGGSSSQVSSNANTRNASTSSAGASLIEGVDTLIVSGGTLTLNSGASSAKVSATSPNSVYLVFPNASANGFTVDGVAGAITSASNPQTGFFAGGSPAILDTNLHVFYGGLSKDVLLFINSSISDSAKTTVFIDKDDTKKTKVKKECGV